MKILIKSNDSTLDSTQGFFVKATKPNSVVVPSCVTTVYHEAIFFTLNFTET